MHSKRIQIMQKDWSRWITEWKEGTLYSLLRKEQNYKEYCSQLIQQS